MTRRYLTTLVDDPTLAAQAHAAILALPGVVGVEEVGAVEVRRIEDGSLDEVVGVGRFHLERMDVGAWWMEIEGTHVTLATARPSRTAITGSTWSETVADEDDAPLFLPESEPDRIDRIAREKAATMPGERRTGEITLNLDALDAPMRERFKFWTPPARMLDAMRMQFDGAGWYVVDVYYDVARMSVRLALVEELAGDDEESPPVPPCPEGWSDCSCRSCKAGVALPEGVCRCGCTHVAAGTRVTTTRPAEWLREMVEAAPEMTEGAWIDEPPPYTVADEDLWPVVAQSRDWDNQHECQANRTWRCMVRQHADGRAIVYGVYTTQFQAEVGTHAGYLLAPGEDVPAAIRRVGEEIGAAESVIRGCIADLPAEVLE